MHIDDLLIRLGAAPGWSARQLQRDAERGLLLRLRPGVYVQRSNWDGLRLDERHLLRMHALAARQPVAVFSHSSAALAHGLPLIRTPELPEIAQVWHSRGGAGTGLRRRTSLRASRPMRHGGLQLTPVARTVLDLAASLPFREALAPLDAHLRRGGSRAELLELLESVRPRGARRAERAIAAADPRSENAAESFARGTIIELGFPCPDLQVAVPGFPYRTDFGWLELLLRGEMDGLVKYVDASMLGERTTAQVVLEEKRREDEIRLATGHRFVRWTYDDVLRVHPLRRKLLAAGLQQSAGTMR